MMRGFQRCFQLSFGIPWLGMAAALALVSGCASEPEQRFYVLTTANSSPARAPASSKADALVIHIAAISLPDLVDRPQIVTRDARQGVIISEQNRWAAALQSQIAQVLADGLSAQLGTPFVTTYPQDELGKPDVRLSVAVQRFDAEPGKEVVVDAIWFAKVAKVAKESGTEHVVSGHAVAQVPLNKDAGYAAIVAAYRSALDQLVPQIAAAVRTVQEK